MVPLDYGVPVKRQKVSPTVFVRVASVGWFLTAAALLVWSLDRPACDVMTFGGSRTLSGWQCLLWGVPFYPSNAVLVLGIVYGLIAAAFDRFLLAEFLRSFPPSLLVVSTTSTLLAALGAWCEGVRDHPGCAAWIAAHVACTLGVGMRVYELLPYYMQRALDKQRVDAMLGPESDR